MAREGRSIITQFVSNLISQRQARDWHVPGKLAQGFHRFETQSHNLSTSFRLVVHAGQFTATPAYTGDWNNGRYLTFTDIFAVLKYALAVNWARMQSGQIFIYMCIRVAK